MARQLADAGEACEKPRSDDSMPFSSLLFLSVFLPLFLLAYFRVSGGGRNVVALAFSAAFYAWGAPKFLPVVLALGVIDFQLARAIVSANRKRLWLALGVTMHLSTLAYFKYANFFVGEFTSLFLAGRDVHWVHVVLPIGISFITFEEISYLVDVSRGDAAPANRLDRYLLFLMLFPHSIAGPIFRWKDLESQLGTREVSLESFTIGLRRFVSGLAKKILIADAVGNIADPVFAVDRIELSSGVAWCGAIAYTIQIYFDFSGYSDMAIGLGRMIGFRFKENFDQPYSANSIIDFWRRWHISLSTWLRDYLYRPLGGNRVSPLRTEINVFIVFLLSGLWHGAAWTFVVWGIYHGALSLLERRAFVASCRRRLPRFVNVFVTFILVVNGWVFFRASTLTGAARVLRSMWSLSSLFDFGSAVPGEVTNRRGLVALALALVIVIVRGLPSSGERPSGPPAQYRLVFRSLGTAVLLALSVIQLTNSKFTPLIYFKF